MKEKVIPFEGKSSWGQKHICISCSIWLLPAAPAHHEWNKSLSTSNYLNILFIVVGLSLLVPAYILQSQLFSALQRLGEAYL